MKILAIETSCDDTCIALAECPARNASPARHADASHAGWRSDAGGSAKDFKLLSNLVSSQVEIHQKWGGIYPSLARREHQRNLVPLLKKCLRESKLLNVKCKMKNEKLQLKTKNLNKILEREEILYKQLTKFLEKYQKPEIDLIAVTVGPGLEPCLWTGINFAKALACCWELPIIAVNHIEAHILANFLPKISLNFQFPIFNFQNMFPAIALIVSGGHTQLILIKNFGEYKILGETRDDAAGEAFDKIARILGLGYPGGPAIAVQAAKHRPATGGRGPSLPRPMLNSKDYDFSFSGLKTAVLYNYKKRQKRERGSKNYIKTMAREAQQAIIDVLIKKTIGAAKDYKVKTILLGGGVAANKKLRKQFREKIDKDFKFQISDSKFCTDNAAMVAATACFVQKTPKKNWQTIKAQANLRIEK